MFGVIRNVTGGFFVVVSFSCEVLSQCGFICIPKIMPVGTMTMYCDGML